MKFRLTKQEKHWILYDVGNSAFILMVSTIFPIYFNSLAGSGGLSSEQLLSEQHIFAAQNIIRNASHSPASPSKAHSRAPAATSVMNSGFLRPIRSANFPRNGLVSATMSVHTDAA